MRELIKLVNGIFCSYEPVLDTIIVIIKIYKLYQLLNSVFLKVQRVTLTLSQLVGWDFLFNC